jgi:hypothetical protein
MKTNMTDKELLNELEVQKTLMMSVATGGPQIESVNGEYSERRRRIADELTRRRIDDPNPYTDLWRWYGSGKAGTSRTTPLAAHLSPSSTIRSSSAFGRAAQRWGRTSSRRQPGG